MNYEDDYKNRYQNWIGFTKLCIYGSIGVAALLVLMAIFVA